MLKRSPFFSWVGLNEFPADIPVSVSEKSWVEKPKQSSNPTFPMAM
jgi:hypothetical protein